MFYNGVMDAIEQLKVASAQMSFEQDIEHSNDFPYPALSDKCHDGLFVHPAILPNGQKIKLLKNTTFLSLRAGLLLLPIPGWT